MKILQELELKVPYAPGYFYLGKLYSDAGNSEAALKYLEIAEKMFQEMGIAYWLAKTQAVLK